MSTGKKKKERKKEWHFLVVESQNIAKNIRTMGSRRKIKKEPVSVPYMEGIHQRMGKHGLWS